VKTNCTGSSSTYASGVFTTLSSGGTCAAPSTITAINTNANAVNFTWPAVAGASGYTVEYKLSTTSTWTTANTTSASYNASGLAAGVYNCRVKTNCAINVSSAYTNGANFQAYCTAGGNTADEFIDNVAVKTIARTSGADGGYIFLLSPKPNIVPGTTYTLTYSAGYTSTVYTEVFKAYIDYNRDGDFVDANETLFTQTVTNGNNTTSTFTVPSTATLGSSVLRIQMNYNAAATSPCGTLQYGEIEDYAINLSTTPSLQNSPEVESALSLKETGLVIYPNPSAQTIYYEVHNIDKSCNALVQIISIDGKVMQQVPVSLEASSDNKNSLDISQLRTGNYFIRVINDEVRMQGSFIKE
jgi:putative intracellular protease/amidase